MLTAVPGPWSSRIRHHGAEQTANLGRLVVIMAEPHGGRGNQIHGGPGPHQRQRPVIARQLGGLLLCAVLLAGCAGSPPATPAAVPIPPIAQQVAVAPSPAATAEPTSSPGPLPAAAVPSTPTVAPQPRLVIIITGSGGDGLSLRKTPGTGDRLKVLKDGAELTVLGAEQQAAGHAWAHVKDQDGTEGWVAAEFTTPAGANAAAVTTATGPPLTPTAAIIATPTIPPTPKPGGRATPQGSDCPAQAPIKGNQSGLYHLPGGASYAATKPEACFATSDDAEAAGFTRAKR